MDKMEELAAYFYESVFLAYVQYRQTREDRQMGSNRDRREAIDAAIALYHLREHVPKPFQKRPEELARLCPDYDLLRDVVNAAKHSEVTRHTAPQISRADNIQETLVCTRYRDEKGEYSHQEKIVEVKLDNGSTRDLFEVLTNVLNMWLEELHRIGAIDSRQPIRLSRPGLVSREHSVSVMLQITAGIRWKQQCRLQWYDYESNEIKPVDLSDRKGLRFVIRKPRTFEIQLHDPSGFLITREVELTPEQAAKLEQIADPGQQDKYLLEIAVSQGITGQMLAEYLKDRKTAGKQ